MSGFPPGSFEFADRLMDAKTQEAQHDARIQRLLRQVGTVETQSHLFFRATLARLGQRLSAWGAHLHERYSTDDTT